MHGLKKIDISEINEYESEEIEVNIKLHFEDWAEAIICIQTLNFALGNKENENKSPTTHLYC